MAGLEPLLITAKGEPVQMGKFSPKQQPEGPTFYELDMASGEQTGCLDPRAQTSCVTQPWCACMCEEERRLPAAVSALYMSEGPAQRAPMFQPLQPSLTVVVTGDTACVSTVHKCTYLPFLPQHNALHISRSITQSWHTFPVIK